MGAKRGLPLISLANANEIERVFEVQHSKVLATVDAIEEVGGEGKWVTVLLRDLVETTIIDAET